MIQIQFELLQKFKGSFVIKLCLEKAINLTTFKSNHL